MLLEIINTIAALCMTHGDSNSWEALKLQKKCQYELIQCVYKTDASMLSKRLQDCIIERGKKENQ